MASVGLPGDDLQELCVHGHRFVAALYEEVENGDELRGIVVNGKTPCDIAIADTALIFSWRHVESAAHQAVRRRRNVASGLAPVIKSNDVLKTRTVHSEFAARSALLQL